LFFGLKRGKIPRLKIRKKLITASLFLVLRIDVKCIFFTPFECNGIPGIDSIIKVVIDMFIIIRKLIVVNICQCSSKTGASIGHQQMRVITDIID
jgi:hypothetical protein